MAQVTGAVALTFRRFSGKRRDFDFDFFTKSTEIALSFHADRQQQSRFSVVPHCTQPQNSETPCDEYGRITQLNTLQLFRAIPDK